MSLCKPQNINCYTDIYYLDILSIDVLSIRNYPKLSYFISCIEWEFSFDRARPGLSLSRIEPTIKEKSIAICICV